MDELVTWLREQIDRDRTEVESGRGPHAHGCNYVECCCDEDAETLARCEAYEAVLREHFRYDAWLSENVPDLRPRTDPSCMGCGRDNEEEPRTKNINECPTLRALALAYRHRPGYREEWRP